MYSFVCEMEKSFVCGEDFIGFILALCRDLGLYTNQTHCSTCVGICIYTYVLVTEAGNFSSSEHDVVSVKHDVSATEM